MHNLIFCKKGLMKTDPRRPHTECRNKHLILIIAAITIFLSVIATGLPAYAVDNPIDNDPSGYWTDTGNYATEAPDLDNDTYTIDNAAELAWVAVQVNSGNTFAGYTIKLAADIDLSDHFWLPIGNDTYSFSGVFDGNNKVISYLTYREDKKELNPPVASLGLFNTISGALIENLGLESIIIYTPDNVAIGGLAVQAINSTISNCYTAGTIYVSLSQANVGGMLGVSSNCTISDCGSSIRMIGGDHAKVGGLISNCSDTTITNSFSAGYVLGGATNGGLLGSSRNDTLTNCFSTGYIMVKPADSDLGGLIGYADTSSITNCYSAGEMILSGNPGNDLGAFIGHAKNVTVDCGYWNSNTYQVANDYPRGPATRLGIGKVESGNDTTTPQNQSFMISNAFVTLLNENNDHIGGTCTWITDTKNLNNNFPLTSIAQKSLSRDILANRIDTIYSYLNDTSLNAVTINALDAARKAAITIRNNSDSTQTEIDTANDNMLAALDRIDLENDIRDAKYLDTDKRWPVIQTQITEAENVIANASASGTDITQAINRLYFVTYQLNELEDQVSSLQKYTASYCSANSYAAIQAALAQAAPLLSDPYWKIDEVESLLDEMIRCKSLVEMDGHIDRAKWLTDSNNVDQNIYKTSTLELLNKALTYAQELNANYQTAISADIYLAANELAFVNHMADLEYLADYFQYLHDYNYSDEDWAQLLEPIDAAKTLLEQENPRAYEILDIDEALDEAYNNIVFVFSDVSPKADNYTPIMVSYYLGLMDGDEAGKFNPTNVLSKELADFIAANELGKDLTAAGYDSTTDPEVLAYFPNNTFGVSGEKCAYAVLKLFKVDTTAVDANTILKDITDINDIDTECKKALAYLLSIDIIEPTADGKLEPKANMTRVDLAMLYTNIYLTNDEQDAPTGLTGVAPTTSDNLNGLIMDTTTAMEYRPSTTTRWTAVTGAFINNLTPGDYEVRYMAKNGYNAGAIATITVPVYHHHNNDNSSSSSGVGSSSPPTTQHQPAENQAVSSVSATAKVDDSGKASASVSQQQVSNAIAKATSDAAAKGQGTKPAIEIKVEVPSDAKTVEASIQASAIKQVASSDTQSMTISSPIAAITFDKETLAGIADKAGGDVNITASNVDVSSLSSSIQEQVGDHPVFNFSVTSGGSAISQFDGSVTVEVPYTLKDGEDASNVVIYYINASGELETVKDCYYDEKTGNIVFATNHFSKYAVGYNKVSFSDVSGWYADYVSYLAARNIISGNGDGKFSPSNKITRAEFAQILANMSGADLSTYTSSSFADVKITAWYSKAVSWAYSNGVVMGTDGKFNPDAFITRQDMALMLDRYTEKIARTTLPATISAITFADQSSVADYAKEAVSAMQQAGIISGRSNNTFDPKANATRAECSKMIALLLQNLI